ncbi:hypothetical protein ACSBL2_10420 [Pedobacter sp. AW31-3R]|uniref:hypothetical protein n=1 Tax=Pedobacter sp. AW31-3R TaxID=3445781 RepID=UPI003F9F0579
MGIAEDEHLEIEIDKLTNSIVDTITGESFETEVNELSKEDIKSICKKNGWLFNWKEEYKRKDAKIYKLTILARNDIQGLVSLSDMGDHMFLNLAESAPFNRNKKRLYQGVGGNLFAFCCKQSFDTGNDGIIAFVAKTKLIQHYQETLGAEVINGNKMAIFPEKALILINHYFNK